MLSFCAVLSHSVVSNSLRPYGLWPARLLCPWGLSRQEYWSGLPCPSPGDLPNPGIEPLALALAGGFLTHWATWEALLYAYTHIMTYVHMHIATYVYVHTHTCIWFYSCMIYYVVCTPGFCSLSTMSFWGKIIFLLWGTILYLLRRWAAFLASTHEMLVVTPRCPHHQVVTTKNVSRHCQLSPGGQNCPHWRINRVHTHTHSYDMCFDRVTR